MASAFFPGPGHDHTECIETAVSRAKTVCKNNGIKFTDLRERVFRTIASSHTAIGAYDIIEMLAGNGRRIAPISMYRILDALAGLGLIHRLESRNAYFACHSRHKTGECANRPVFFLICRQCSTVLEMEVPEIEMVIKAVSGRTDFRPQETLLEITGLCSHCASGAGDPQ